MDALTFYKLAKGFQHINAFAATVQSAHETGNWTSYLWLNADNVTHYDIPLSTIKAVQLEMRVPPTERYTQKTRSCGRRLKWQRTKQLYPQ